MYEMSHQNPDGIVTLVRADEVLRSMQRTQDMQRQLLKQMVLASIKHCPVEEDVATLRELWQKFKPMGQDADVVYTFMSRFGSDHSSLFGQHPWYGCNQQKLPAKFHSDPKALLALLPNDRGRYDVHVPACLRDSKEQNNVPYLGHPSAYEMTKRLYEQHCYSQTRTYPATLSFEAFPNDSKRTRNC
jgi:hypothetical protein